MALMQVKLMFFLRNTLLPGKTIKKHTKNVRLRKVGHWLHFSLQKGLQFRGQPTPKITTIPKIIKTGQRSRLDLQND